MPAVVGNGTMIIAEPRAAAGDGPGNGVFHLLDENNGNIGSFGVTDLNESFCSGAFDSAGNAYVSSVLPSTGVISVGKYNAAGVEQWHVTVDTDAVSALGDRGGYITIVQDVCYVWTSANEIHRLNTATGANNDGAGPWISSPRVPQTRVPNRTTHRGRPILASSTANLYLLQGRKSGAFSDHNFMIIDRSTGATKLNVSLWSTNMGGDADDFESWGLTVDENENVYVAWHRNEDTPIRETRINKYNVGGTLQYSKNHDSLLSAVGAIWYDPSSSTLFASLNPAQVDTINITNGNIISTSASTGRGNSLTWLVTLPPSVGDDFIFAETGITEKPIWRHERVDVSNSIWGGTELSLTVQAQPVAQIFHQFDWTNALAEFVSDTLALSQVIGLNVIYNRTVVDTLALTDLVERTIGGSVTDTLALNDVVALTVDRTISDTLALTDLAAATTGRPQIVTDTLNLTDLAEAEVILSIVDALNLTQVIARNVIYNREIIDTLNLTQGILQLGLELCSGEGFTPVPALGISPFVTLTFPFVAPALTVNLRVPEFGNIHRLDLGTVVRRNRGGALKACRPVTWPMVEELQLTFENLSDAQKIALAAFLITSAGLEIGLLDHENRQWKGVIITPSNSITHANPGCSFETGFTFRGKLQP